MDLVHRIEDVIGKQLEEFESKTNEVLGDLTKVGIPYLAAFL